MTKRPLVPVGYKLTNTINQARKTVVWSKPKPTTHAIDTRANKYKKKSITLAKLNLEP